VFVDLGDDHALHAAVIIATREKTHPGLNLVYPAKRLGGHPLLQHLFALAISIFGRQRHLEALALYPAIKGAFEGGQQPPAAVLILQRLVAPHRRTDVANRAIGAQRVVESHVLSVADLRRQAEFRRRNFMLMLMVMVVVVVMVMRMSRGSTYHSSFSILRTTQWVSRVMI